MNGFSLVTHGLYTFKTKSQKSVKRRKTHSSFAFTVFHGLEQDGIESHLNASVLLPAS